MMKKEQVFGAIREILTILGALAFAGFEGWESIVGLLMAFVGIAWGFWMHEGIQIVFTSIRKALSLVPGVLVEFGVIDMDQAALWVSMLAPVAALAWSIVSNGPMPKTSKLPIWAFIAFATFVQMSCGVVKFNTNNCVEARYTEAGHNYTVEACLGEDGEDFERVIVRWNNGEGNELRSIYYLDNSTPIVIQYDLGDGVWVEWGAKSGVNLGFVPPEVQQASGLNL